MGAIVSRRKNTNSSVNSNNNNTVQHNSKLEVHEKVAVETNTSALSQSSSSAQNHQLHNPQKLQEPSYDVKATNIETEKTNHSQQSDIRILTTAKVCISPNPAPSSVTLPDVELSLEEVSKLKPVTIDDMWSIVKKSSTLKPVDLTPATCRKGWKTIRIFVSSTFKDFHHEREVLVKEVFPDLRLWCEARKLRLVECDLRWGVPKDSTTEDTIKICLSELDRCYDDNTAPFFLNLAGDRTGWIPSFEDFSANVAAQYGWVYGLSVTEMEIVHGAFRKLNPNALFLMRHFDGDFPDEKRQDYISEGDFFVEKLKALKDVIQDTFPEENVKHYHVQCDADKSSSTKLFLKGLSGDESDFTSTVYNFFQQRIEELYPLDSSPMDPLQTQRESHEMFLDSRSSCVLGRDKILSQIEEYVVNGNKNGAPLLVVGYAGAGKSALMAKSAHRATQLADLGEIKSPMYPKDKCRVFFHFVGATPRSTDLASFLQRLTKEVKPDMLEISSDLDSLISLSNNLLSNEDTKPIVVFIDAVNQMDEDKQQYLNRWLPEKIGSNVRVIISTIEGTVSHQTIRAFPTSPMEIICGPLDKESRKAIVENILRTYNKRLDDEQLGVLLEKVGSSNPLWLTLACEELRVYGQFETLIDKIKSLPDDLISLEEEVFARFEKETGGELMKACVCMLEVSRHGLLETELLALLGEERNTKVPEYTGKDGTELLNKNKISNDSDSSEAHHTMNVENIEETKQNISKLVQETYVKHSDSGDEKKEAKLKRPKGKQINFLPARDWAVIYRNLKPLLRPCGDLGEGRLDFYHRSLSKAVRRKYFSGDDDYKQHLYNFWHGVLADYFEGVEDMDRKAEELPYHLEQLLDNNRLIRCLMDWEVFDRMYSEDFSIDLLHSWRQCGGYGIATAVYREQLAILKNSSLPLIEYVEIVEKVYGFLIQAGQYSEALELMQERLNDELQLGERPDELADVYQNMARCKSDIDKAQQYLKPDQLDDNKLIVEYGRKCLKYREQLTGADNQYRCALANILISHHLSNVADITHENEPRTQAFEAIRAAIKVFSELNDIGHLAECKMTEAIIDFRKPFKIREKLLLEALKYCLKGYGEKHLLTTRIYLNTGIAYEMDGQPGVAYEYFCKLKETCMAVFGPSHPKTVRAINTLEEPTYKRMAEEKARSVPETA